MAFYKSKRMTASEITTLLTIKKSNYFKYSDYIVNYSFYKAKKPYLKIKKVITS